MTDFRHADHIGEFEVDEAHAALLHGMQQLRRLRGLVYSRRRGVATLGTTPGLAR